MGREVETITVDGRTTALGSAGPFTVVVDRPPEAGGGGQGFDGGQLFSPGIACRALGTPVRLAGARVT